MSLRLKINAIVGAMTLLFSVALLFQQFDRMRASVNEEVVAANRVATQLLNRTVWGYAAAGPQVMQAFLRDLGRVRSTDITLLDPRGAELYRSPPSTYKSGRDAPGWFERLVSPEPSVQSIEFPDGKLVVRANASRAVLDAWDEFTVMLGLSCVLLVVANAMVFWLVGRTVRPFRLIVQALEGLQAGRFDVALPRLRGTEAAAIGAAFNRMLQVLQDNIANERRAAVAERELSDNRELTRWMDRQIEQERHMIARELHDELGQSVTAIRSMALSIAARAQARDAESERAARLIADESSRLYRAMHGMIPRLVPLVLDSFGLDEALRDLVERTRRSQPGLSIDLQAQPPAEPLSDEAAITLYRAAQEGITNALRHGQASALRIALRADPDGVLLEVTDDGTGVSAQPVGDGTHYGLRWLAERVEGVGGRLALQSVEPRGARLTVRVPVARRAVPA